MSVDQMTEPELADSPEPQEQASTKRLRHLPTRRSLLRWLLVLIVAAGGLAWLLSWWSPVPVRSVTVVGASEESAAAIESAAGSLDGQALRDVDIDAIVARVSELPGIQAVDLTIQRPWTVAIVVDERYPFAQVKTDSGYAIIDEAGGTIRESKKKNKRLPRLVGDPESRAASIAVLHQLPQRLGRRVVSVTSAKDGRTKVTLRSGLVIEFGSDDSIPRKAEVAVALLRLKPKTINVSVPERPAVTGELTLPRKNQEVKD